MDQLIQKQITLIWAKSNRKNPKEIHLLLFHLLESAAVAWTLWQEALSESIKKDVADWLHIPVGDVGRLLAYWVGLHDIGKASPVFQGALEQRYPELIVKIRETGLPIDKDPGVVYHSQISGKFIRDNYLAPKEIDIAISGHHGMWNSNYSYISSYAYGSQSWDALREALCCVLKEVLGVQPLSALEMDVGEKNAFTTWFSGFICVADWISSDETCFTYCSEWKDPALYFAAAREKAKQSLTDLGWIGWRAHGEILTFYEMYPSFNSPNEIQQQTIKFYEKFQPNEPFLMIVEAPTGIGKTEIAMYLADRWLQQADGSGLYIAMPTQATSNQIYHRSLKVLADRYPDQKVNVVLAHAQACWNKDLEEIRVASVGEIRGDLSLLASEWFQNNRKRTLLAAFAVGTVDQVFLSILQTRHFFVRLFGLKNKVVIFDEVHAYDTYMNELFHRLLEWLHSFGVTVIILSATLPEKTRKEIMSHYCGIPESDIPIDDHYPRVSIVCPGRKPEVEPLVWTKDDRQLKIRWEARDNLPDLLNERLSDGGCAAVICNTVKQAQQTYLELKEHGIVDEKNLILFHARFPFGWRDEIEQNVLSRFGKEATCENGDRPYKAIIVATQVIEQSLDLDFDFMVTELAPVDLILQRAGRLHRHTRQGSRPPKLSQPELTILEVSNSQDGIPKVGEHEPFYPKSVLLKTYYQLKAVNILNVIPLTRRLIENVYETDFSSIEKDYPEASDQLKKWIQEEREQQEIKADTASLTVIGKPGDKRFLTRVKSQLIDDDENNMRVIEHLRAKTRDGENGIRIPCLFTSDGQKLFYDLECREEVGEKEDYGKLSKNEIGINKIALAKAILQEANDLKDYFKNSKTKYPRKEPFLLFNREGKINIGGFHLEISHEMGLIYH